MKQWVNPRHKSTPIRKLLQALRKPSNSDYENETLND